MYCVGVGLIIDFNFHHFVFLESRDRNDSKFLDRYSSAVLENLDNDGRHSPGDPPIQSSTPFASRPVNPTPAQAAGGPTPTASRPTNPTPRQASNVISSEAIGMLHPFHQLTVVVN